MPPRAGAMVREGGAARRAAPGSADTGSATPTPGRARCGLRGGTGRQECLDDGGMPEAGCTQQRRPPLRIPRVTLIYRTPTFKKPLDPLQIAGKTGGETLILPGEAPISVAELTETNDRWLPDYMAGKHN